jgi:hypothetical protein
LISVGSGADFFELGAATTTLHTVLEADWPQTGVTPDMRIEMFLFTPTDLYWVVANQPTTVNSLQPIIANVGLQWQPPETHTLDIAFNEPVSAKLAAPYLSSMDDNYQWTDNAGIPLPEENLFGTGNASVKLTAIPEEFGVYRITLMATQQTYTGIPRTHIISLEPYADPVGCFNITNARVTGDSVRAVAVDVTSCLPNADIYLAYFILEAAAKVPAGTTTIVTSLEAGTTEIYTSIWFATRKGGGAWMDSQPLGFVESLPQSAEKLLAFNVKVRSFTENLATGGLAYKARIRTLRGGVVKVQSVTVADGQLTISKLRAARRIQNGVATKINKVKLAKGIDVSIHMPVTAINVYPVFTMKKGTVITAEPFVKDEFGGIVFQGPVGSRGNTPRDVSP